MKINVVAGKRYHITTDISKLDIPFIHRFLSKEAGWSKGIPYEKVEKAVRHSLNFGLFDSDFQIGYARVITDHSTIAYLGDVFVAPAFRGKGLSKLLMETVMAHPDLQGLRRWILVTKDAHGLYSQYGWTAIEAPSRWMEIAKKDIYETSF